MKEKLSYWWGSPCIIYLSPAPMTVFSSKISSLRYFRLRFSVLADGIFPSFPSSHQRSHCTSISLEVESLGLMVEVQSLPILYADGSTPLIPYGTRNSTLKICVRVCSMACSLGGASFTAISRSLSDLEIVQWLPRERFNGCP